MTKRLQSGKPRRPKGVRACTRLHPFLRIYTILLFPCPPGTLSFRAMQRAARSMGRKRSARARARTPAEKEPRKSAVPVTIALKAAAREQTMKKLTERRQGRSLDQYIPYTRSSGPLVACQSSVLPTVKPLSRLGFARRAATTGAMTV